MEYIKNTCSCHSANHILFVYRISVILVSWEDYTTWRTMQPFYSFTFHVNRVEHAITACLGFLSPTWVNYISRDSGLFFATMKQQVAVSRGYGARHKYNMAGLLSKTPHSGDYCCHNQKTVDILRLPSGVEGYSDKALEWSLQRVLPGSRP